jgi:hypothetical protein
MRTRRETSSSAKLSSFTASERRRGAMRVCGTPGVDGSLVRNRSRNIPGQAPLRDAPPAGRSRSMSELRHKFVTTNGIRMHYVEQGTGPLVVLCHGFPESWYSWRHQLPALATAGFRAVAPDQREYGQTDRPERIEAYDIFNLVGDVVGLVNSLGVRFRGDRGPRLGSAGSLAFGAFTPRYFPGDRAAERALHCARDNLPHRRDEGPGRRSAFLCHLFPGAGPSRKGTRRGSAPNYGDVAVLTVGRCPAAGPVEVHLSQVDEVYRHLRGPEKTATVAYPGGP